MSANYAASVLLADKMLSEYGTFATLQVSTKVVDPSKPWEANTVTTSLINVSVVLQNYQDRYVDGQAILRGDCKALIPAAQLAAPPAVDDVLTIGTDNWKIISCVTVSPGGVPILYKAQVRRSL